MERRSLRVPTIRPSPSPTKSGIEVAQAGHKLKGKKSSSKIPSVVTPLDLGLDLAAQQTKLGLLQDEIDRCEKHEFCSTLRGLQFDSF
jgi:hypothetical protein